MARSLKLGNDTPEPVDQRHPAGARSRFGLGRGGPNQDWNQHWSQSQGQEGGSGVASSSSDTRTQDPTLTGDGGSSGGSGAGAAWGGGRRGETARSTRQRGTEEEGRQEGDRPKEGEGMQMSAGKAREEEEEESGGQWQRREVMAPRSGHLPMYPYEYEGTLKLVIIGPSGVGKSAMLLRYCDHGFNSNLVSTVGVDFKFKDLWIRGKAYRLNVVDTAGQEKFYALSKTFYRGCHGVLLAYDISNRASFLALDKWHSEARENMPRGALLCLVGTKLDKAANGDREVTYEEGLAKMAAYQASGFYEVSSLTGENIKAPFLGLVRKILDTPGLLDEVKQRPYPATLNLDTNPNTRVMDAVCQC